MASFPYQSQGLFDSDFQNGKRKSQTVKAMDNPLLGKAPPVPRTENSMVLKQSTNEGTLRQRRTPIAQESPKPTFKPPPKSSLSLGTGRNVSSIDTPKVYGIDSQEVLERCKEHFSKFGSIIATKGSFVPGQRNWIAFQYQSSIQAQQASSVKVVPITKEIFCGVTPLADDDPLLTETSHGGLKDNIWESADSVKRNLLSSGGGIDESDILLGKKEESDGPKKRSCCERFARLLLKLDD
eukprot:scaffold1995_cov167-Amphora_coffeaeformis.AAC.7